MRTTTRKIAELSANPANPRVDLHPEDPDYRRIHHALRTHGLVEPLLITPDGRLIDGHQRLKVLRDLGHKQVACVVLDVDPATATAVSVALDKIDGRWDNERLTAILTALENPLDAGFTVEDVERLVLDIEKAHADDFLDPLVEDPAPIDTDAIDFQGDTQFDVGDWTKLSYVVTHEERDVVIRGLRTAQAAHGTDTLAQTLLLVCRQLLESLGLDLDPKPNEEPP